MAKKCLRQRRICLWHRVAGKRLHPTNKIKPNEHLKEYLKTTPLQRLEWLEQANKFVYENHLAKIGTKPARTCPNDHSVGRATIGSGRHETKN
ncbi:MAG: hypothetical protein V1871_05315 [Planctomycetota bacterium]